MPSIRMIAEEINVTKDTAWLMIKRIEVARIENHIQLLRISESMKSAKKSKFTGMKNGGLDTIKIHK